MQKGTHRRRDNRLCMVSMSRIGKQPIVVPSDVTIEVVGDLLTVRGPLGVLLQSIHTAVELVVADHEVIVQRKKEDRTSRAIHGLTRTLIANMVAGVTKGWQKELEMSGVGYRSSMQGADLLLAVGYSHPVTVPAPSGIAFRVSDGKIVVTGIDKALVGQVAANIRAVKPPEPYKGKGIRYVGEKVRRKAGKVGKVGGEAGK